ncbi:hypothetical protein [Salinifilum ghardaiensis]
MESTLPIEELDTLIDDLDAQVTEEQVPEAGGGTALCHTGALCTILVCA